MCPEGRRIKKMLKCLEDDIKEMTDRLGTLNLKKATSMWCS